MERPPELRHILCIRPDGLGDMVCATPAFASLRAVYPDAEIVVLASPLNAPLLDADPHVSETLLFDRRGRDRTFRRQWAIARALRRRGFDAVFAFRTAMRVHLIAGLSGARYRVGYADKPLHRWLTHALRGGHRRGTFREVDRNLRLLDLIGIPAATRRPRLYLRPEERERAVARLREANVPDDVPLIGIHPGASTGDRCYPEERYADAANVLAGDIGGRVLLFGGPADETRVQRLRENLRVPYASFASVPLREMMALFAECDLILANDSGPMHIAAALDVPLVAVFGPGDHVRWMPESERARMVRPDPDRPGALEPVPGASNVLEIPAAWIVDAGRELLAKEKRCGSSATSSS